MDRRGKDSAALPLKGLGSPLSIELAMGVAIETHRTARGMSPRSLAAATGIPLPVLQDYEAGVKRAGGSHVLAMASALGISISQLFANHPGISG